MAPRLCGGGGGPLRVGAALFYLGRGLLEGSGVPPDGRIRLIRTVCVCMVSLALLLLLGQPRKLRVI